MMSSPSLGSNDRPQTIPGRPPSHPPKHVAVPVRGGSPMLTGDGARGGASGSPSPSGFSCCALSASLSLITCSQGRAANVSRSPFLTLPSPRHSHPEWEDCAVSHMLAHGFGSFHAEASTKLAPCFMRQLHGVWTLCIVNCMLYGHGPPTFTRHASNLACNERQRMKFHGR